MKFFCKQNAHETYTARNCIRILSATVLPTCKSDLQLTFSKNGFEKFAWTKCVLFSYLVFTNILIASVDVFNFTKAKSMS